MRFDRDENMAWCVCDCGRTFGIEFEHGRPVAWREVATEDEDVEEQDACTTVQQRMEAHRARRVVARTTFTDTHLRHCGRRYCATDREPWIAAET
jgi:hypothetical protein